MNQEADYARVQSCATSGSATCRETGLTFHWFDPLHIKILYVHDGRQSLNRTTGMPLEYRVQQPQNFSNYNRKRVYESDIKNDFFILDLIVQENL